MFGSILCLASTIWLLRELLGSSTQLSLSVVSLVWSRILAGSPIMVKTGSRTLSQTRRRQPDSRTTDSHFHKCSVLAARVYAWALKGFLYHHFRVYVHSIMLLLSAPNSRAQISPKKSGMYFQDSKTRRLQLLNLPYTIKLQPSWSR